ncbi:MAG TPA: hypothetical protein VHE53_04625 [Patescibacteria group bacterium]|nr:hypothetical protein [Patescibacteria group bacterium]
MRVKVLFLRVLIIAIMFMAGFIIAGSKSSQYTPQAQAQACPTPSTPTNVLVEFPSCVGSQCNFTQAKCSWGSVSGATSYKLVVTEVESGTVVVNEQPSAGTTSKIFNVTANKTYKCDVSAVNSCGATGAAGSHSLLCAVDALVETPTATPAPVQNACGYSCTSTSGCQAGLTCAMGANGQGYCAIPAYSSTCSSSPSISSCCTAPTTPPKPTVPPTGGVTTGSIAVGFGTIVLLAIGIILVAL